MKRPLANWFIWFNTELHASCRYCDIRYTFGKTCNLTDILDDLDGHDCLRD